MKLVVTNDGKVGKLVLPLFTDGKQCYIAAISNGETEHTLYSESECEIIEIEDNSQKIVFSNKEFKRLYENIERECNSSKQIENWLDENCINGAFNVTFNEMLCACKEVLNAKDDLIAVMICKHFIPNIVNGIVDIDKQYKLASNIIRNMLIGILDAQNEKLKEK